MAGANMKIREIIMELGPVQHQDYTRIDSTPYEVKSKVNKREYNFAPSNAGVEGQLYRQVDKKLLPLIDKLAQLKGHVTNDKLYQRISDKEMYVRSAIDA